MASWSSKLGGHVGFKTLNVVRRRSAVQDILALGGTAVICTEDEDLRDGWPTSRRRRLLKVIDCVRGQVGAHVSRALDRTASWSSTVRCPCTAN